MYNLKIFAEEFNIMKNNKTQSKVYKNNNNNPNKYKYYIK